MASASSADAAACAVLCLSGERAGVSEATLDDGTRDTRPDDAKLDAPRRDPDAEDAARLETRLDADDGEALRLREAERIGRCDLC